MGNPGLFEIKPMQATNHVQTELNRFIGRFNDNPDVKYQVRSSTEKHLTGASTNVVVITFFLSGIFGGLLSAAGKDLWQAAKELFVKLKSRKEEHGDFKLIFKAREQVRGVPIEFHYSITPVHEPEQIQHFVSAATSELKKLSEAKVHKTFESAKQKTIVFDFDGTTMSRRS